MRVSTPGQCSPGEREEREDRVTSCGQGQQVLALDQRRGSPHLRPHRDHRGERGAGDTLDKTDNGKFQLYFKISEYFRTLKLRLVSMGKFWGKSLIEK